VLNAGGSGNITGFTVGAQGDLSPIAGSTRPLSGSAVGPAQIQFSSDGGLLVVTEKATNKIDTYTVDQDGLATGPNTQNAAGVTPNGSSPTDVTMDNGSQYLYVLTSGAHGISSFGVNSDGSLTPIAGASGLPAGAVGIAAR